MAPSHESNGGTVNLRRYAPIAEALALLAVTFPLALVFHLPTLWLLAPVAVIALTRRPYERYGLTLERPGSAAFHVCVATLVFAPYVVGHYLFARWWLGATFHLRLPPQLAAAVIDQFLIIALPEECFFRGYLQTQLDAVLGKPYRLLGAQWGVGLPLAAALFAACHVVYGGPVRLIVFFPALWYGWLRARTGTILVPTAYHAVSNLLMSIMLVSLS